MTAEVFTKIVLIGIKGENDSNEAQFAGIFEDLTEFNIGEKEIEGVPLLNGGRIVKKTPQGDGTLTFKAVPITLARDGTGVEPYLAGTTGTATPPAYTIINTNRAERHRVVIVFADIFPDTAEGAITADGNSVKRVIIANAYVTATPLSFDDKYHTAEMTIKWAPFKKDGTSNIKFESGQTLSAVSATATNALA